MHEDETRIQESRETINEMSVLLSIAQKKGYRLAIELHGESYASIRELNELLRQARQKMELIRQTAEADLPDAE
jgi:hypothetical protein